MSKRSILLITCVMALVFPRSALANDTIKLACFGGLIDQDARQSLFKLGEDLRNGTVALSLPDGCMKTIRVEHPDKVRIMPNPYISALELAAGQKTRKQFAAELEDVYGDLDGKRPIERGDEAVVSDLRIGCGRDRECVSEIVAQINGFHPEQSIFFCDFAPAPASSVTTYFNSYAYLPLPVNCQHRSQYGGDRSISTLDDWFAAFEKLGENRDPKE